MCSLMAKRVIAPNIRTDKPVKDVISKNPTTIGIDKTL